MKGFLVLYIMEPPKIHDVRLLIQLAKSVNSKFDRYEDAADILTPYAIEFRYPGEVMEPTNEEMEEGIKHSEEMVDFVVSLLPDEIQNELNGQ